MNEHEIRKEIEYRQDRETRYVEAYVSCRTDSTTRNWLLEKIKDNNETIRLLGKYLETEYYDGWERFYRQNYWDKQAGKSQ